MTSNISTVLLAVAVLLNGAAYGASNHTVSAKERAANAESVGRMKIRIKTAQKEMTATLGDNATARDFAALLPLTLTLEDYARTEKISDLPKKLSTDGAPAGIEPSVGDIAYYSPWGNLAIFYKDFRYSSGLVKLGGIDSGMEALSTSSSVTVTIELASNKR